jgi:hypothetical protein
MPLWGKINQQNNAPKFAVIESQVPMNTARGSNTPFNNVSVGVFHPLQVIGVWGANASQVTGANAGKISHTGWHIVRRGTGPVRTLTATVGGTGFANLAVGTVTSSVAGGNATFYATTNATGGITALTLISGGKGFVNTTATITAPANGIINVAIGGGLGYSNADTIVFSNGQVNATATLVTNATGGITSVTLTSAGRGFPSNTGTVVTITTSGGTNGNVVVNALGAGSGQTITYTLGGRGGRLHYECLVAGSITGSPPATLP